MRRRPGLAAAALLLGLLACRVERPPDGSEAAGEAAPDFTLEALDGSMVSLASLRGKPVVLDFWATWCSPCVFQIPILNAFHERNGDRVEVLGVAIDVDGREVVAPFADEHDIGYRVLLGDTALAQSYQAMGFPTLYVIDEEGVIRSAHIGVLDGEDLVASVEAGSSVEGLRRP